VTRLEIFTIPAIAPLRRLLAGLALVAAATGTAAAHKPSDAHVRLEVDGSRVTGRIDVALRDLDAALALDDGDGALTWGEVSAQESRIADYLGQRLSLDGCTLSLGAPALVDLSDGAYWSTPIAARCASDVAMLSIRYALLFDIDAQHRGLVHVADQTIVIRDSAPVTVKLGGSTSTTMFIHEGVWHIWIGLDHVLFLLCLLLPAVFPQRGHPMSLRSVAVEVFEIVTAFTLAHSITLVVSAIGLLTLPSRFVETAIALSVVAAALNNLVRLVDARWAVAFALGLLHGFGFSSVLIDLGLPSRELVGALLCFNVGVELGQAAIVLAVLPILYLIRRTIAYRALLFAGSGAAALLASFWTYQRIVM
jgi:hypothetical protein